MKSMIYVLAVFFCISCIDSKKNEFQNQNSEKIQPILIEQDTSEVSEKYVDVIASNQRFENKKIDYQKIASNKIDLDIDGNDDELIFLNAKGWENDPGDFRKFEIRKNQKLSLSIKNFDSWIKVPDKFKAFSINEYSLRIDIGLIKPVLVLFAYGYASQPGYLTVISFDKPLPKVVFNKKLNVTAIEKVDGVEYYKLIGNKYGKEQFEILIDNNELKFREVYK